MLKGLDYCKRASAFQGEQKDDAYIRYFSPKAPKTDVPTASPASSESKENMVDPASQLKGTKVSPATLHLMRT